MRISTGLCSAVSSKWKTIRMANGLQSKVNVQFGPREVTGSRFPHVQNFPHGSIFEPWEILVRREQLLCAGEQPDAVHRDVRNLNF